MKGFVPTPELVVDLMVDKLFDGRPPARESRVLDPGCGPGAFIAGILRWCERRGNAIPQVIGMELDPNRYAEASARFAGSPTVRILQRDFLAAGDMRFDYVVGNPPYVAITSLSEAEKRDYRTRFQTACGRFDLYLLFFEQSLRMLERGGRLVFITPEKFLYVQTASPLRRILGLLDIKQLDLVGEETFEGLVTYPTITTVENSQRREGAKAAVRLRDGTLRAIDFPRDGSSLLPLLNGYAEAPEGSATLAEICLRVSCGVATGADQVFVHETTGLSPPLQRFAFPTVSGRQLAPGQEHVRSEDSLLIPYDRAGSLLPFEDLGALGVFLSQAEQRRRLEHRTCVKRKPWYAFHDSVPLDELLQPKLLCKDITAAPAFWLDRQGEFVPRHSVYYIVPKRAAMLEAIADYLNSPVAISWLRANCQRAANGFIRLQSATLKRLPIPESLFTEGSSIRLASQTSRKVIRNQHAALLLSR